jgi:hypothetical protein
MSMMAPHALRTRSDENLAIEAPSILSAGRSVFFFGTEYARQGARPFSQ